MRLISNVEVATRQVIAPSVGPTRAEEDFVYHLARTVDSNPAARWRFIIDQLNIHLSEALVRLVVACYERTDDLE